MSVWRSRPPWMAMTPTGPARFIVSVTSGWSIRRDSIAMNSLGHPAGNREAECEGTLTSLWPTGVPRTLPPHDSHRPSARSRARRQRLRRGRSADAHLRVRSSSVWECCSQLAIWVAWPLGEISGEVSHEVGREIFGNVPGYLKAAFYIGTGVATGVMFYLFSLRAKNWSRGQAESRTATGSPATRHSSGVCRCGHCSAIGRPG